MRFTLEPEQTVDNPLSRRFMLEQQQLRCAAKIEVPCAESLQLPPKLIPLRHGVTSICIFDRVRPAPVTERLPTWASTRRSGSTIGGGGKASVSPCGSVSTSGAKHCQDAHAAARGTFRGMWYPQVPSHKITSMLPTRGTVLSGLVRQDSRMHPPYSQTSATCVRLKIHSSPPTRSQRNMILLHLYVLCLGKRSVVILVDVTGA